MLKRLSGVVVAVALATACSSQKVPATAAVTAADQAFAAVKAEATKYVPDEVKDVQGSLDSAKADLAKGDYQAALTTAQALPAKISALSSAIAAKKAEMAQTWATLSAGLPQVIEAIKSRVEILAKAKKLPAGMDAAKLDTVKADLASITQAWGDATTAAGASDVAGAMAKAAMVKSKAAEALGLLGMPVPAGLTASK